MKHSTNTLCRDNYCAPAPVSAANIAEAEQAQSRADFISKMNIGLKEAAETDYWIRLLAETGYLNKTEYRSIIAESLRAYLQPL